MRILLSKSFLVEEFDPDIWITTDFESYNVPYTIFYNGEHVFIHGQYRLVDVVLRNTKRKIRLENYVVSIINGTQIGIAENYLEDVDFFFLFDKTVYTSKFLLRKAQIMVASDISKRMCFAILLFKDRPNYIRVFPENGIVDDSMSYVLYEKLERSEIS
ncbi:hypothetical protein XJ44_02025 [Thermosipho affectus]|uniref:Uncharacterized protein n=1 Tax=Thermosipho affectus TaxID=660294 RepID=A0ABX3IIX2_9BACT|nr:MULTISPECIES: hypothetical protein [Thermosipho]ANQ53301.1 hypothetical protein Y592_02055 [Thermosipho sp. 1070]APT71751.1 hypothetical protein BG95_02050 [Thermosipho sp. 1063]ONN27771.1 hypothetical protein XJ44_02025 [Thermosipho affectus]OOC45262.1 hypothetical protein XO08_02040 [Thermosipho sp. 1074]